MGSEKRTRQRENRQAKQEAQRRRDNAAKWRRRLIIGAAALIVLVGIFWLGGRATDQPSETTFPPPADAVIPADDSAAPTDS